MNHLWSILLLQRRWIGTVRWRKPGKAHEDELATGNGTLSCRGVIVMSFLGAKQLTCGLKRFLLYVFFILEEHERHKHTANERQCCKYQADDIHDAFPPGIAFSF